MLITIEHHTCFRRSKGPLTIVIYIPNAPQIHYPNPSFLSGLKLKCDKGTKGAKGLKSSKVIVISESKSF